MARSITDARQVTLRTLLQQIANRTAYLGTSDAKPANQSELDNLLSGISDELKPLLQMTANNPNSLIVNIGPSVVANAESGFNRAPITIGANTPNITSGTLTFPAAPGTVTVSPGNNAVFSMGANEYIKALVYLDASDAFNLIFGTANAAEASATVPAPPSGTLPVGFITIQTVASVVQNIAQTKIYQFAGAAGAGSGSGSGVLSPAPGYKMLTAETFDSIRGSVDDTTDITMTNATYDAGKKLYKALLDKSKTVSTNAGTALTISGSPTFTVAANDIVYITSGARSGQWRRIASISSQTSYTLDSAFTGGNASAADTLMVAQAIWTKDLINFGSASELTRPRDFYPAATVTQLLVDYSDSLTAGDDVGDFTQTARMVVAASNEGLQAASGNPASNLYTPTTFTRPAAPGQINDYILGTNTDTQRLFLVFFPNPTNGSVTSTANLLSYECNFYNDAEVINGGVLDSAYGLSDASGTPYNMTVTTTGGLTRADLGWSFNPSADPGGVASQLEVSVNGQSVPKFVSSAVTPSTQLSYTLTTDANGLYRRVQFNMDLSLSVVDIKITRQFGVYDASFTQTNKLTGLYDAIVGSASQVTAGTATHSSLQAAHDAVAAGSNILILNNVALSGNTTLTKQLLITGKGIGSVLTGTLTFASGSAGTIVERLKITSTITFNTDNNYMNMVYQTSGQTLTNDVMLYPNNIIQVIGI